MGWATRYIQELKDGNIVMFRPRGSSMRGKIESGQQVKVFPTQLIPTDPKISVGDVVLCKVHGAEYLHLIKAIRGDQYQIGNNRGGINGWTGINNIYGLVIEIKD